MSIVRSSNRGSGGLVINVRDYGAVGDGAAADKTAIDAAIATVVARSTASGIVYFPAGIYLYAGKLTVPKNIYLVGESPYAVTIRQTSGSVIPVFIEMGFTGTINTYGGIKGIQVDSNFKANTGVLMYGPQEGSGLYEAFILNSLQIGADVIGSGIVGGTNMFEVARCWVWAEGDSATTGLRVSGGVVTVRTSTFVATNRTVAPPAGSAGVAATDSLIVLDATNSEHWHTGYLFTRCTAELRSPESSSTSYGVRTSSDSTTQPLSVHHAGWSNSVADVFDEGMGQTVQFCNGYNSSGTLSTHRHFLRGWPYINRAEIYKDDDERTTLGYTSPATGELVNFKVTTLTPSGWGVSLFVDGADGTAGAGSAAWNGLHLRIGTYHLWVDSSNRLRIRNGAPTSDTDGTIVGSQA